MRSPETLELLQHDALAFVLLAIIAHRARWRSEFSTDGLQLGEALIGDCKKCGLTRQQYRTRVARLVEWGLITSRATPKGTIAKLTSTAVFDLNSPNEWLTSNQNTKNQPPVLPMQNDVQQPTANQQPTTCQPLTNNDKKEKKKKETDHAHADAHTHAHARDEEHDQSFSFSSSYQDQGKPARDHPKWPEFAGYCRTHGGRPTEKGFRTWLSKQKPQWRNKAAPPPPAGEIGWDLQGKFYTKNEAQELGLQNPELATEFRAAKRLSNGRHKLIT